MNRKLPQLLQPSLQLYFICLILFALASAMFSLPLAILELAVVVLLALYHRSSLSKRRREITKYIENITGNVDIATKDTMVNSPLPMIIFRPESGDIIWTNDRFLRLTGDREHLFDAKLETVLPDFDTRWLLEARYILDYSDSELAREMGVKPTSVRMALTRARKKARAMLRPELEKM